MYYIQVSSQNDMMSFNGWVFVNEKSTKKEALEELNKVKEALEHSKSTRLARIVSVKDWRKELFGA